MSVHLLHGDLTEKILNAYHHVYRTLGHGFLETVYRRAMVITLHELGVYTETEVPIDVYFDEHHVGSFRVDILAEYRVIVECKACECLSRSHEAQLINYLRATEVEVGLLLNFGSSSLQFKRMVFTNDRKRLPPKKRT